MEPHLISWSYSFLQLLRPLQAAPGPHSAGQGLLLPTHQQQYELKIPVKNCRYLRLNAILPLQSCGVCELKWMVARKVKKRLCGISSWGEDCELARFSSFFFFLIRFYFRKIVYIYLRLYILFCILLQDWGIMTCCENCPFHFLAWRWHKGFGRGFSSHMVNINNRLPPKFHTGNQH